MKIRSILVSFLGTMVSLHAQQAAASAIPPMPPGPPVQLRAPDFAQWVVKFTVGAAQSGQAAPSTGASGASTGKPNNESKVTFTKTGKIMERERIDDQGRVWSTWCLQALQITLYPDGNVVMQPPPAFVAMDNPLYEDYSRTDFPRMLWVSTRNYAGIKSYNGKSCLYFKDRFQFPGTDVASDVEAYTDLKTRFPIASIVSGSANQKTYAYEFQAPPAAALTLPENVQSALDKRKKAQSSTRLNPAP